MRPILIAIILLAVHSFAYAASKYTSYRYLPGTYGIRSAWVIFDVDMNSETAIRDSFQLVGVTLNSEVNGEIKNPALGDELATYGKDRLKLGDGGDISVDGNKLLQLNMAKLYERVAGKKVNNTHISYVWITVDLEKGAVRVKNKIIGRSPCKSETRPGRYYGRNGVTFERELFIDGNPTGSFQRHTYGLKCNGPVVLAKTVGRNLAVGVAAGVVLAYRVVRNLADGTEDFVGYLLSAPGE